MNYEEAYTKALHNAIYWHNRCEDLKEIIELMCLDAESYRQQMDCMKYPVEQHERFALV